MVPIYSAQEQKKLESTLFADTLEKIMTYSSENKHK